ncbi:hypothetical protein [Nocardia colli]|uniref:hypothetical protein n=1 Tax=Nocardia colli TaxID=2545717 RepID=UPI00168D4F75|nr:hypothetical protein [Nocardia colli]
MGLLLVGIGTASAVVIATHGVVVAAHLAQRRPAPRRRAVAVDVHAANSPRVSA